MNEKIAIMNEKIAIKIMSHDGFRMNIRSRLTCDGILLILSEMFIFYH